jgi:hypothetical protein
MDLPTMSCPEDIKVQFPLLQKKMIPHAYDHTSFYMPWGPVELMIGADNVKWLPSMVAKSMLEDDLRLMQSSFGEKYIVTGSYDDRGVNIKGTKKGIEKAGIAPDDDQFYTRMEDDLKNRARKRMLRERIATTSQEVKYLEELYEELHRRTTAIHAKITMTMAETTAEKEPRHISMARSQSKFDNQNE